MPKVAGPQVCSVDDCGRQVIAWGWCENHYRSWKKTGDPIARIRPVRTDTCEVEGCSRKRHTRGWCYTHWRRWRSAGQVDDSPIASRSPRSAECSVDGCDRPVKGRGWCKSHWLAWTKYGDPLATYAKTRQSVDQKHCRRCDRVLPRSSFNNQHRNYDGLQSQCKDCHRELFGDVGHRRRARLRGATVERVRRSTVFTRDEWRCGICEDPISPDLAWPDPMSPSVDHVVPIALGGPHSYANVQAAHLICNLRKSAKPPS